MIKLALTIAVLSSFVLGQTETGQSDKKPPSPRLALLAGLIPGGGQLYNQRWIKALIFAGVEAYYISQWQISRDRYRHYKDSYPISRSSYLERRNKFAWWVGIYYVMGMLDAYVDAHLITFPEETVETDQEIPSSQIQELQ